MQLSIRRAFTMVWNLVVFQLARQMTKTRLTSINTGIAALTSTPVHTWVAVWD
jgi:hypothetical protein